MNVQDLLDAFPSARIDNDNAAYFRGLLQQRLLINRCNECHHWHHPPRPICPKCWSDFVTATEVAGTGSVALVTVLRQGRPEPGVDFSNGHALAAVELDEQPGLRIASTILGPAATEVTVGQRVKLVWRSIEGRSPRPDFAVVA